MQQMLFRKYLVLPVAFLAAWLGLKYLFPPALPFLMGTGLAFAAEPFVRFGQKYLRLPRMAAAGAGVTVALLLAVGVVVILSALLVRELSVLAGIFPNVEDTLRQGLSLLEAWLLGLVNNTPEGIKGILTSSVSGLFSDSSAFLDKASRWVLSLASSVLVHLPDSALGLGTAVLASYMLSAKLPKIRTLLAEKLPQAWKEQYLPTLKNLKDALFGWLRAQLKLSGITFLIVTMGLILLRIPYAPVWALLIALVDAVPLLGTGTILLPWALVSLLQDMGIRALGLLGIFAVAALTRSALEPRLVGKHLGLDPLVTLIALYTGYQIWGIGGMILSPLVAVAVVQLTGIRLKNPK